MKYGSSPLLPSSNKKKNVHFSRPKIEGMTLCHSRRSTKLSAVALVRIGLQWKRKT